MVTATLTGRTAAGKTVICSCWIAAMSVEVKPGKALIVVKAEGSAVAPMPAPDAGIAVCMADALMAASWVDTLPSVADVIVFCKPVSAVPMAACNACGVTADKLAVGSPVTLAADAALRSVTGVVGV